MNRSRDIVFFIGTALGLIVTLAVTQATTAEPWGLCAWALLGAFFAGSLLCGVRLCRAVRAAEASAQWARAQWRAAETKAARYQSELDELRKRHLNDLATSVQALMAELQERGQELEEDENWWKLGGQRGDEP